MAVSENHAARFFHFRRFGGNAGVQDSRARPKKCRFGARACEEASRGPCSCGTLLEFWQWRADGFVYRPFQRSGGPVVEPTRAHSFGPLEPGGGGLMIRVLYVAAQPVDTQPLDLKEEVRRIRSRLHEAGVSDQLDFEDHSTGQFSDLTLWLVKQKPNIVHFSGHGTPNAELVFMNGTDRSDPVALGSIVQLFSGASIRQHVRCIVLNACYGEALALELMKLVDFVIACPTPMTDAAAIAFSEAFYPVIAHEQCLRAAMDYGLAQFHATRQGAAREVGGPPKDGTADGGDLPKLFVREGADPSTWPSRSSAPVPTYRDAATRALVEELDDAIARKLALEAQAAPTGIVKRQISEIQRKLRDGGQLRAGDRLDRYKLWEQIGNGGFASVWKVLDPDTKVHFAIKVLHPNLAGDVAFRDRFFRGAREMAGLDHPAIVKVLESPKEDQGFHFFVMEYVEGGDLQRAVEQGRVPKESALPIVLAVGEGLAVAHGRGLVHRDVKPANVLLGPHGEPKLTDFDLVGGTDTGVDTKTGAMGTLGFAAPEMLSRPQDATASADVYGLAMTAVFVLHGGPVPYTAVRDTNAFVDTLRCTRAVKEVLKRALDWEADKRFKDAGEFCTALTAARSDEKRAASDRRVSPTKSFWSLLRFNAMFALPKRARWGIGIILLVAVAAFFGVKFIYRARKEGRLVGSSPAGFPPRPMPPGDPRCPGPFMTLVPGGSLHVRSREGGDEGESPVPEVTVATFCLETCEVPRDRYDECVNFPSNGVQCGPPGRKAMGSNGPCSAAFEDRGYHPANCVTWKDAETFCRWAGGRLPTGAEWEYAASGGAAERLYPWGNDIQPSAGCMGPLTSTCPIGAFPSGDAYWGHWDMAGNVAEWTADSYPLSAIEPGQHGGMAVSEHVVKGSSWRDLKVGSVSNKTQFHFPDGLRTDHVGIRCASDPKK